MTDMTSNDAGVQLTARNRAGPKPKPTQRLHGSRVLLIDRNWATSTLLRNRLEQDYGCTVETVTDYDDALDVLGIAARPVHLVMLDPSLSVATADTLMLLLQQYRAGLHVTLHGSTPPEKLPYPSNFVGAAAYTHLATSAQTVMAADDVMRAGLTVRAIADSRIIPATLDWASAIAIYQGDPGQPFPLTVRI